jgi:DHA1 family inner membrane transport protein
MFMGLTIANVGGVPAAAWVGQEFGWRLAFGLMPILGFLSIAATWLTLPKDMVTSERPQGAQLQVFRNGRVWLALLTTVMGSGSMFSLYTYIAPILTEIAGFKVSEVSGALVLVGVGFTVGNVLSGRMADRNLDGTLRLFLVLLAIFMFAFPYVVSSLAGALVIIPLWGLAAFAVITPLQISVIRAAREAPALASSLNIGAFNVGNALGAAVGATLIELGLDYDWLPVSGAVMALAALALVLIKAHLYGVDRQAAS